VVPKKQPATKEIVKLEIHKEQLLPEGGFISYCNNDPSNRFISRLEITRELMVAAERDHLLMPLFSEEQEVKDNDGVTKLVTVNYYSPYQLLIVLQLKKNIIDEDGRLRNAPKTEWVMELPGDFRPRFIAWGPQGNAFAAEGEWWTRVREDGMQSMAYFTSQYLHSFLKLLHSIEKKRPYYITDRELRYFDDDSHENQFDLQLIKEGGKHLLSLYDLTLEKLEILRKNIAQVAEVIDPLEYWHYYIARHPKKYKSLLKGEAGLAQELYCLYTLLTKVWELVAGKTANPIFDFDENEIGSSQYPHFGLKYREGKDIEALLRTIAQFNIWSDKEENVPFVSTTLRNQMAALAGELLDYEKIYGKNRSYEGSVRYGVPEKDVLYENLDDVTKADVDDLSRQDFSEDIQVSITWAIESRLDDLQHKLRNLLFEVSDQINDKEHKAWGNANGQHQNLYWVYQKQIETFSHAEQIAFLNQKRSEYVNEAKRWQEYRKKFYCEGMPFLNLIFCARCRNEPVRVIALHSNSHYLHQKEQPPICKKCRPEAREETKALSAPLKCEGCKHTLYKFLSENEVVDNVSFEHPSKKQKQAARKNYITLDYGRLRLRTICEQCGKENNHEIEYGWMPAT